MKNNYLILLYFCFVLAGCTTKTKKSSIENVLVNNMVSLPEIDLQKKYPSKKIILQDIADVNYIPIETNDSVLLSPGNFSNLVWKEDYMIVYHNSTVFFLNGSGKFQHSFNRSGASGEEYTPGILGMCVDFPQKEIFIYDFKVVGNRIYVYSFDGKFKRVLKVPDWTQYSMLLYELNKDYLFVQDTYNIDKDGKEIRNNAPYYKISKANGVITQLPLTIPKRIGDGLTFNIGDQFASIAIGISSVMKNGSEIIISDFGIDTVYSLKNDVLTPIAVRKNRVNKDGYPILAAIQVKTDRYILWDVAEKTLTKENYRSIPDPYRLLFDKYTGECFEVDIVNADGVTDPVDLRMSRKLKRGNDIPENYAVRPYGAEFLIGLYKEGKLKGRLKEIASKLKEDDNPVLMVAKFKE